jgi:hypothetical protein
MWLLLLAMTVRPESECVQLSLRVVKAQVLVAESTRAVVTWRVRCDTELMPPGGVELLLDDGTGFRSFSDVDEEASEGVEGKLPLRAGEVFRSTLLVGTSGRFLPTGKNLNPDLRFAFPRPGSYKLQVHRGKIRSNVVVVNAKGPEGGDVQLLDELVKAPELTTKVGIWEQRAKASALTEEHPGSSYLGRLRLALWEREISEALVEDRAAAVAAQAGRTAVVLRAIEAADLSKTAFQSDQLLLVAGTRDRIGDAEGARRLYQRLAREHPDTPAGERAGVRLNQLAPVER